MQKIESLEYGKFYHIYNCGINGEPIFREETNYEYFLRLYNLHISNAIETIAWCLMGNHFHLLVRIREENEILLTANPDRVQNPVGVSIDNKIKPPHQYFSNLFNSYTQAFNKMYLRHGGLFERPFKRKLIASENYFKHLIVYIHNNPVHHGFCEHPAEYVWSSYKTFISDNFTNLRRDMVLEWFDSTENFIAVHQERVDLMKIEEYLQLQTHSY